MRIRLWTKATGTYADYDSVDAREILERSDLYTNVNPNPDEAKPIVPPNVSAADEYRCEPVGEQTPGPERTQTILRNATGTPRLAVGVSTPHDHFVRPKPAVTGLRGNQ
jgi:hypothetical protein